VYIDTKTKDVPDGWDAYPRGSFIPHRTKGWIFQIGAYVRSGAAGGKIYFRLAPTWWGPIIREASITVPANTAAKWMTTYIHLPWAYDTLFIWSYCDGDVERAYEYNVWLDGSGMGMADFDRKGLHSLPSYNFWHRVLVTNLNVGDVPVSGTVNVIPVPSSSTGVTSGEVNLIGGERKTIIEIKGAGKNLVTTLFANDLLVSFRIIVDGVKLIWWNWDEFNANIFYAYYLPVGGTEGFALTKYDTTNARYAFLITHPIEWQKSLKIEAYNPPQPTKTAYASVNYLKLA